MWRKKYLRKYIVMIEYFVLIEYYMLIGKRVKKIITQKYYKLKLLKLQDLQNPYLNIPIN